MQAKTVHAIATILRKTRLLKCADHLLFIKGLINNRRANKEFLSIHGGFSVPPAHLAFDAYGHTNWKYYFDSGVNDAKVLADILNTGIPTDHIRILEWGCGPARIIRQLKGLLTHKYIELYGSDYNAASIKWCQNNIGGGVKFFVNQSQPPFPFEANSLDCVYTVSVFTHLSEAMHFEWMGEIRRVLKPGGLIILTTHGDSSTDRLLSHEKQLYVAGKLVVRGDVKEGKKWYLAYHPPKFIKDILLKGCDIVSHGSFPPTQDIWVARKKCKQHGRFAKTLPDADNGVLP